MLNEEENLILIGSKRLNRLYQPLSEIFNLKRADDVLPDSRNLISDFKHINSVFSRYEGAVITDSLGKHAYAIGHLCSRNDLKFIVRPRGGFWGESSDYHNESNIFKKFIISSKDNFIRDCVMMKADQIIPVSQFLKTQIKYTYPKIRKDINVIHEPYYSRCIKSSNFRNKYNIPEDSIVLVTVTSFDYLSKSRGIIEFSPIINSIMREDESIYLVIAGDGKYQSTVAEEIRESFDNNILDRIIFPGYVDPVEKVYIDSDIFLYFSYRDTLGLVLLEAQAAGLPVITNSGGGMEEIVNTEAIGNSVIKNEEQLRKPLVNLVDSYELIDRIGESNRRWVKNNFSPIEIGKKFRRII